MNTSRRSIIAGVAAAPLAAAQARPAGRKKVYPPARKGGEIPLFSSATAFGDFVFIAGHGVNIEGGVQAQTKKVLDDIEGVLKQAGSSMEKVLKVNVYLKDIGDFEAMNQVYRGRFGPEPPVRTTVQVAAIALKGCLVEIEAIAHV